MIGLFKQLTSQQRAKKNLTAFLAELEKNLETFYVMDQRQFITQGFLTRAWESVKTEPVVQKHASIVACMGALEEFNRLFKEHKEFELWYTADMARKTPENARRLHGMKHELDKKLRGLESFIIPAGQDLEREMVQLGWLKA